MKSTFPGLGTLFVISAPSGAGKTSLVKALTASLANVQSSVSYTTRLPRPGEKEGVDYHFIDIEAFNELVAQSEFLEHAEVFGNFYGTSRQTVDGCLASGIDVVLEIDWQGARQIRAAHEDCLSIFILPPSRAGLESRLRSRKQDSEAVIQSRMTKAINEIKHYEEFDYLIVNDDFDQALNELKTLLLARRLGRRSQSTRFKVLLSKLLAAPEE